MAKDKEIDTNKNRRQSNKAQLRAFRLDSLLQKQGYTTEELKVYLGDVSDSTVHRTVTDLRRKFGAPIDYSYDDKRKCDCYHYTNTLFRIPAVFVPEDDMATYSMVSNLYAMFKDTPLWEPLLNLKEAFQYPVEANYLTARHLKFKEGTLPENQWFETRIVMANQITEPVDNTVWECILTALKDNYKLRFDYETVENNIKSTDRIIEPWQLIYGNGEWYLRGRASGRSDADGWKAKTFVVPRIQNITLLPEHFALPADEKQWKINKRAVGNFGVASTDRVETYRFIFQRSALHYARRKFSDNMTVEPYTGDIPHEEGALLVSFPSNQGPGILKNFLSFGADIVPLEPESLVTKWKENVRRMAEYLKNL